MRGDREPFVDVVRDEHQRRTVRREAAVSMSVSAAPPAASRPVYGSSSNTTVGSWTIARAIDTRCWSPRLSARTGASRPVGDADSLERAHRRGARIGHAIQPRRELDVLARRERAIEHALM